MKIIVRLLVAMLLVLPLTGCGFTKPSAPPPPGMGPQAGIPPGLPQPGGGPPGFPQPGGGPPGLPQPGGGPPGLPERFDPAAIDAAMRTMNPTPINDDKQNTIGYTLSGDKVNDQLFKQALIAFTGASQLSFNNTPITNATFKELAKLNNLQELDFTSVKISDADLKDLSAMLSLEKLKLYATGLTDAGAKELAAFIHLKVLKIEKERLSDAAVEELKKALPNCKVDVTK
jgi:hypothetical protein